jgi:hypothetical protein
MGGRGSIKVDRDVLVIRRFTLQTESTSVNEAFYLSRHGWPIEVALEVEKCFGSPEMATAGGSMCFSDENQTIL